jgi:hypothetical protein
MYWRWPWPLAAESGGECIGVFVTCKTTCDWLVIRRIRATFTSWTSYVKMVKCFSPAASGCKHWIISWLQHD